MFAPLIGLIVEKGALELSLMSLELNVVLVLSFLTVNVSASSSDLQLIWLLKSPQKVAKPKNIKLLNSENHIVDVKECYYSVM